MKILIVATNVSTRFGGEAILPWHYFRLLRQRGIETWLVAHERTRDELLALLPAEADRMHFVPDQALHRWLYPLAARLPRRIADMTVGWAIQVSTALAQRTIARGLVRQHAIDVVHEPVPVSPKQPSFMRHMGAPVVIGPLNGGMTYPPAFAGAQGWFERAMLRAGRAAANLINAAIAGKREAAVVLVANDRTRRALPRTTGRVIELAENGVDLSLFKPFNGTPLRSTRAPQFAFLGRLIDLKAIDLLLEAMGRVRSQCVFDLHIIGDGSIRPALEAQASSLNLTDHVIFHGFVPQDQCPGLLASCDALILPSLHECGGAVVLEAMAMGLPVIATKWGGPTDYLDASCGILVEPDGREELIAGLAAAMVQLAQSPELRQRLGRNGRMRVLDDFDWQKKIDRILQIYAEAVAGEAGH